MAQELHLNCQDKPITKIVHAVQNDTGRVLKIYIEDRSITHAMTFVFIAEKPSGLKIYNSAAYVGGHVEVELTNQTLAEVGNVKAQLQITDTNGLMTSYMFYIAVDEVYRDDSSIESSNEFTALQSMSNDFANMKGQFEQAIAAVTVDSEVITARTGADGTQYSTLSARLNAENTALNADLPFAVYNIFDKTTVTLNQGIKLSNGDRMAVDGLYYSEIIRAKPNITYRVKNTFASTLVGTAFYDINKQFISSVSASVGIFTTPANCAYMRITGQMANLDTQTVIVPNKHKFDDIEQLLASKKALYTVSQYALRDSGYESTLLNYSFSIRNICVKKGEKLYISVSDKYRINVFIYDAYGNMKLLDNAYKSSYEYNAKEDTIICCNVIAYDTTTTYNNDYEVKTQLIVLKNNEDDLSAYCPIIKTNLYASDFGDSKFVRIPSIFVTKTGDVLIVCEVREGSVADVTPSQLGFYILRNGIKISNGYIEDKLPNEIRQFNPQLGLVGSDIVLLWSANTTDGKVNIHITKSSNFGQTWKTSTVISNTISGDTNILTAPANFVQYDNKLIIPIYKTKNTYDENYCFSGIMKLTLSTLAHSEKYCNLNHTNECNVIVYDNKFVLFCRNEAYTGGNRRVFATNVDFTEVFSELSHYYTLNGNRYVCQESYYKTTDSLYFTAVADNDRNKIKLYHSAMIGVTHDDCLAVMDYPSWGYSCIDVSNNALYIVTEGGDGVTALGKILTVSSIIRCNKL